MCIHAEQSWQWLELLSVWLPGGAGSLQSDARVVTRAPAIWAAIGGYGSLCYGPVQASEPAHPRRKIVDLGAEAIPEQDVVSMNRRLAAPDHSLNATGPPGQRGRVAGLAGR